MSRLHPGRRARLDAPVGKVVAGVIGAPLTVDLALKPTQLMQRLLQRARVAEDLAGRRSCQPGEPDIHADRSVRAAGTAPLGRALHREAHIPVDAWAADRGAHDA